MLDDERDLFRQQLKLLRRYGDFISLDEAIAAMAAPRGIGGRYFCLTFDDGFKNCFSNAVPILKELRVPAAFFISTNYIGLDLDKDWEQIAPFYQRSWSRYQGVFEFLSWDECRQISNSGFTIGSHTHTHVRLTTLDEPAVEFELSESKREIESQLGVRCRHFCCPWGKSDRDFNPRVHPQIARKLGYASFLTAESGLTFAGASAFSIRRTGCETGLSLSMFRYSMFPPFGSAQTSKRRSGQPKPVVSTISVTEMEPVELAKFPYPYEAAFSVASDTDGASLERFRSAHSLFCGNQPIQSGTMEGEILGLDRSSSSSTQKSIDGFGFDFADSFFLVGDQTTFGMYRHDPERGGFKDDEQVGVNCREFIQQRLQQGQIDSFHAFLHYTREQIEPLLKDFYRWCEEAQAAKPSVWINHSLAVTPTGICPSGLQSSVARRLLGLSARKVVGPVFGRQRFPLAFAFARYQGDTPGSPHYVNDLLAANGLRFVWVNADDLHRNLIVLPETQLNGRATILRPITMNDGVRYYRFDRCYGKPHGRRGGESYLRDSNRGFDASILITPANLQTLCNSNGSCIMYTHWSHSHSFPISGETRDRFALLKRWQDAGRIWVTSTARLLEWTRKRTFLQIRYRREGSGCTIELDGLEDPIFGYESIRVADLHGLCLILNETCREVHLVVNRNRVNPQQVHRSGNLCWLDAKNDTSALSPENNQL